MITVLFMLPSFVLYWLILCDFQAVSLGQNVSSAAVLFNNISAGQVRCSNETVCNFMCKIASKKIKNDYSRGWAVRHQSIGLYYSRLNCTVAVEIGIARAELSTYLLRHVPSIREYHGIDPFLGGYDSKDAMSTAGFANITSSDWAAGILHNMHAFGCRFRLHWGDSVAMSRHFANQSIDCIFIDGDHTYNGCKSDIQAWYPKMKPGGSLIFDDVSYQFPGVEKALNEFLDAHNLTVHQMNRYNNYYVQLPKRD